MSAITELQQQALAAIQAAGSLQQLDELRVRYLGKKGEVTAQLKSLGSMEPEQRKAFGQAVNAARDALNEAIAERRQGLEAEALEQKLLSERVDVTLPGRGEQRGGLHPVTMAMERAIGIFNKLGFDVATGPEVEHPGLGEASVTDLAALLLAGPRSHAEALVSRRDLLVEKRHHPFGRGHRRVRRLQVLQALPQPLFQHRQPAGKIGPARSEQALFRQRDHRRAGMDADAAIVEAVRQRRG